MQPKQIILGSYEVRRIGFSANMPNYHLFGPRAEYRLVRHGKSFNLYVINRQGNVCSLKGNYTFSDESGTLVAVS